MNDHERERLFAELLELHYDCHADPDGLRARVESDPEVRAIRDEVARAAAVIDRAARDPQPAMTFSAPDARVREQPRHAGTTSRWTGWRAAAALLVATAVAAPFVSAAHAKWRADRLTDATLRLIVTGPPSVPDAAPADYRIETWDRHGEPVATDLRWRAVAPDGTVLASGDARSDGVSNVRVPARLDPAGYRFVVDAAAGGAKRSVELRLKSASPLPLVHLSTDKAIYRPGETARLRGVVLDRLTLAPIDGHQRLRVVGPRGDAVLDTWATSERGVVTGEWQVPADLAGGEYTLELQDLRGAFAIDSLPFQVRRYQPPALKTEVVLDRETYAPGETGSVSISVQRLAGGANPAAAGAGADLALVIDGRTTWNEHATLDERGEAVARFAVPETVERGEARLVARIEDRGVIETAVEPFVVPTGRLDVTFYPEGGDLVTGLENRIYAEVADPLGRPADARGRIVDGAGQAVASFATEHQGRARFAFTPRDGASYRLVFESPVAPDVALPAADPRGAVLRAAADSFEPGAPLAFDVVTRTDGPWVLGAFCRGVLVAQDVFHGRGPHHVELAPSDDAAGVLRVTLLDHDMTPVAERLVQRRSGRDLDVAIDVRTPRAAPRDSQEVTVRVRDRAGKLANAVIGLTVTDRAVRDLFGEARIGLADRTWFFGDVDDLEDAHEFFATDPASARHVDLVLGTRGWRRFAWADPDRFVAEHGAAALALLGKEARATSPAAADTGVEWNRTVARYQSRASRHAQAGVAALVLFVVWFGLYHALRHVTSWTPGLRVATSGLATAGLLAATGLVLPGVVTAPVSERALVLHAAMDEPEPELDDGQIEGQNQDLRLNDLDFAEALQELGYVGGAKMEVDPFEPKVEAAKPLLAQDPLRNDRFDLEAKEEEFNKQVGAFGRDDRRKKRIAVREYAHRRVDAGARRDFTETVLWHPLLVTDEHGVATASFDLSDRVTTWSVFADVHGAGRVGQAEAEFDSVIPFRCEPKLPNEVTAGDRLRIPVALIADDPRVSEATVRATASGAVSVEAGAEGTYALAGGGSRHLVDLLVRSSRDESGRLELVGTAGFFGDRVEHAIRVVPRGFPRKESGSGDLTDRATFRVRVPESVDPRSVRATLKLYPSPVASILDGLDGLLAEPGGCFEQTSSRNYPNVMAMTYMEVTGGDDPTLMRRSRGLIERGYAKLVGFECSERGYEWFGGDPGHEALTAYGLLEFHDMRRVFDVDGEMVARTRAWLLGRRDGDGGFRQNARALDTFGRAPADVTDAYVTYALAVTSDDPREIETELDRLETSAGASDDPYVVALAAKALAHAGRDAMADQARDRLKSMQRADGALIASRTSITSSRGDDLAVETTALSVLAWLDDEHDRAPVERAVRFLLERRTGSGTFGATQATILALQALIAYSEASRSSANDGVLRVVVNDTPVHDAAFAAGRRDLFEFDLGELLRTGDNEVALELTGDNRFPWAFDLDYRAEQPADHEDGAAGVDVRLARATIDEGETVAVEVTVENRTNEGIPMTIAIVGLPAGLDVAPSILDDLKDAGRFDSWELNGREVVLYWRGLAPRDVKTLSIDAVARIPGTTTGPASRAYLYYTPDQKRWAAPVTVEVAAR